MRSHVRILFGVATLTAVFLPGLSLAQEEAAPIPVQPDEFLRGTVLSANVRTVEGAEGLIQELNVRLDSGSEVGKEVPVVHGGVLADPEDGVQVGDRVVLVRSDAAGEVTYYLADRYRLPMTFLVIGLLIAIAIAVGGKRGVTATFGLAASVGILALIVLPQLAGGLNPIVVTLLGAVAIATVTTLVTHGPNRETLLVLGSILAALVVGAIGALVTTWALNLGGIGSEEAVALTYGPLADVDLRGLLIAGVILGCLGVLDDVAATQVAAIKEISGADRLLTARQLYRRGMRIGAQHVAALINTLFLAYAGASLPLLLVGMVNMQLPIWAFINTEAVSEEIVRTAVGSVALILAVPIATLFASWHFGARRGLQENENNV